MAKNRLNTMERKSQRATQTPKRKKKKNEDIQKSTPKAPKKDVSSQYTDFKNSSIAPKEVKPKKKETSLQKAQKAFDTGQKVRASQQKNKVTNTSVVPKTSGNITDSFKVSKSDYKKAVKKGQNTTYLGTKQTETTTTLKSKKEQKKEYKTQKTEYYKGKDWKDTKEQLKAQNKASWFNYLTKTEGMSAGDALAWMASDEGKKLRKETYMESKNATKKEINKSIAKGIKDTSKLKSVNALTKGEFDKMVTASGMGPVQGNKYLKSVGGDKLLEKIGSKTVEAGLRSKAAYGAMQGMSKGDIWSGSVGTYNAAAREGIEQVKNSGAYMAGYGLGLAADMGMGGVASRGASLAEMTGKGVGKLVGKGAGKLSEKAAVEAAEEFAKVSGKQGAKRFAKNRAGELLAETPTNVLDAAKMSLDADGNLDKKSFRNWLAVNSAFTFGVGGAMEGIGAGLTRKLGNETLELMAKKEAGTITPEELEQLTKNAKKLSQKTKGYETMSSDIANARLNNIEKRSAKMAKEKAEAEAKEVPKGFHGRTKTRNQGELTERAKQTAKKNENARWNAQVKKDIADTRARTPDRPTTIEEKRVAKQSAKKHEGNARRSAERARNKEVRRLQDEIRTLREQYGEAEAKVNKKENTVEGHAKAQEDLKNIQEKLTLKEKQLAHASDDTLSGRIGKVEKEVTRENTLQGHNKAVEKQRKLQEELVADSKAIEKERKVEQALKEAKKKAKENPTPQNQERVRIAEEAAEKVKTLQTRYKEAGLPDYVGQWTPKEIKDKILGSTEWIAKAEKDLKDLQKKQRKAFANGHSEEGYRYAEQYNELKAGLADAKESLEEFKKADAINAKYAPKEEPKVEAPLAEDTPKKYADFGEEMNRQELEDANLVRKKEKPDRKMSVENMDEHRKFQSDEKAKEQHRKDLANKDKAEKETKGLKSAWKKFYSMFVSELEPWERMAMSAATKEERKAGRVSINKLLTARSKAMEKVRSEGMKIFESRGLHKDAAKAKDYDDYALFKHELDRLKQKSTTGYINGVKYNFDFGEGVYTVGGKTKNLDDIQRENKPFKWDNMSDDDIREFVDYVGLDEWDQVIHDKGFTGYGKETVEKLIKELEGKYGKDITKYQQELVKYHKDLLDEDFAGGIISKERYDKLTKKYENYIPTYREYDDLVKRSFSEDINAINIYQARGAEHMAGIIPQYTQMIVKTNTVMKRVAENEMLNVVSKINNIPIEKLPHGHTPDELIEVSSGVYKTATGEHKIYYRENGKGVSMTIPEEAYHAIKQWSGAERAAIMEYKLFNNKAANVAAKGMTQGARAFKAFITDYSIIFGCRNFVRDTTTALVYSNHPAQWLKSFPKACMAIVNKSSPYHAAMQQYIKDGGRYNALVTSTDLAKMPKIGKKEGIPGLRYIKDFNTAMETLPRMSEYIATIERLAKKEGISFDEAVKKRAIADEAMYNAKEVTLNFDRAGQYGRMLNRGFVPFFNPSVQGLDKLARFLVKDNKSMEEFVSAGMKVAGMVAAPAVAWEMIVGDNEAYQKLSAYNKYAYVCVPLGPDDNGDEQFLKIPRAREIASLQLPIEWFCQNVIYQNRDGEANLFDSAKQALGLGIEQIGPVNPLTDNFYSPIWRLAHNKTWMGGRIEGYEDEDKRKRGQVNDIYDAETSSAAVAIAGMLNDKQTKFLKDIGVGKDAMSWIQKHQMSPKQLDNLFDSYMGVIYDMGIKPFSQKGASLSSVKENPVEETKQWLQTTFGTSFVVNGTLSSQRKSGMYANLFELEDKLKDYDKGSKEYGKANRKLQEYKNNCVYDVQSLDTAIDAINRSTKYTGREKAELTTALKREQNLIIDDFNDGKKKVHDPLETLLNMKDKNGKRVFSDEEVFTKLTYTDQDGNNNLAKGWNKLKSSDYYKEHPKKAIKDFKDVTLETRQIAGKCSDSKSFMDWGAIAIVCEDKKSQNGKDYSHVLDAYGVGSSKQKIADVYVNEMGGNSKTYAASHRHIVAGAAELGTYPNKLKDHDYAMILANARTKNGNKLLDRAYWVEDNKYGTSSYAMERMNYARCLSDEKYEDSKWSYKKVHKFASKYGLDYSSPDEDIVNAINEKYPNKTDEEKAALFGVIKPTDENPFGEVGDYSVDGDSGYEGKSKGGHGHGRRRRRRGGGGGGGGKGAAFKPIINDAGSKSKVTNTSRTYTSKKSNLDDAYRKQLKKLREGTKSK